MRCEQTFGSLTGGSSTAGDTLNFANQKLKSTHQKLTGDVKLKVEKHRDKNCSNKSPSWLQTEDQTSEDGSSEDLWGKPVDGKH